MNGKMFTRIDDEISKCKLKLNFLRSKESVSSNPSLIISTGDISDVDGFYALAKYAQSGADVLFIMNYPAYLNEPMIAEAGELGLGFKYGTDEYLSISNAVLEQKFIGIPKFQKYQKLVANRNAESSATHIKKLFTDLGFVLASRVWEETTIHDRTITKGKLFLCVGGINTVNPFSAKSLKNELFVYAEYFQRLDLKRYDQASVYLLGHEHSCVFETTTLDTVFNSRTNIYIDFNGSMAFYDGILRTKILESRSYIRSVFVMGGVFSYEIPKTMPKIENSLNRFSCATMNQLYSPEKTKLFLNEIYAHHTDIPIFVVTNNVVHDLNTFSDPEKKVKTDDGWKNFMKSNYFHSEYLEKLTSAFYHSHYNPPRKAFDFYVAFALVNNLNSHLETTGDKSQYFLHGEVNFMYTDNMYGVCMVSRLNLHWEYIVQEYYSKINTEQDANDDTFTATKKISFIEEKEAVVRLKITDNKIVRSLFFDLDDNYKLSIKPP